ncbi:MAG: hypothetical protein KDK91_18745, partial [Gammaproteobacteria bacterium]|nr:hypothetical protein [Gammaproteobacteria bacterium]
MVIDVHPVVMRLTRVLTLLVMTLITVGAQAGNDHAVRWLEIDDDNRALWDVSYVDGELPQLRITPRWSPRPEDLRRKIQALVSKKSSSYKLGANALLEVLHQQGIYADVSIANFDKDNARGRELLAHAEAVGADLIFTMGSESAALVIASYAGGRLPVVT